MKTIWLFAGLSVATGLAACSAPSNQPDGPATRLEKLSLSDDEVMRVKAVSGQPIATVIEALEKLTDERARQGRSVDANALADALDRSLTIECGDICTIKERLIQ